MVLIETIRFLRYDHSTLYQVISQFHFTRRGNHLALCHLVPTPPHTHTYTTWLQLNLHQWTFFIGLFSIKCIFHSSIFAEKEYLQHIFKPKICLNKYQQSIQFFPFSYKSSKCKTSWSQNSWLSNFKGCINNAVASCGWAKNSCFQFLKSLS